MDLHSVTLSNGETLTYRAREGGRENLLLIHGNMTSSKHYDVLIEKLDSKFNIVAVDLRGFGGSTYHTKIKSIKDFSDDVKLFIDELGLKDFSIIGWSTGGMVGMQFVADYPGICKKLVLLASGSTRGYPFYSTNVDGTPNTDKRLKTIEEVEKDTGKTIPVQMAYEQDNRMFLQMMWNMTIYTKVQPNPERYEEYIQDMRKQRNLPEVYQALNIFNISDKFNGLTEGTNQAKDITIPVLVLRGDRDYVVTAKMTKEIVEDLGETAKFIELKDCGHSPMIDDLNQLVEHIEEFLKSDKRG